VGACTISRDKREFSMRKEGNSKLYRGKEHRQMKGKGKKSGQNRTGEKEGMAVEKEAKESH